MNTRRSIWASLPLFLLLPAFFAQAQPADPAKPKSLNDTEIAQRQLQLMERIKQEVQPPAVGEAKKESLSSLDRLASDAAELVPLTRNPQNQSQCLTIQLQALYLALTRYPEDADVDRRLSSLRGAARTLKSVSLTEALSSGDLWLAQAELFEIRNGELSDGEKQRQGEQVLRSFIIVYDRGPQVDAARSLLQKLMDESRSTPTTVTPGETNGNKPAGRPRFTPEPLYELGERTLDATGVIRIPIKSKYQRTENVLRVLAPSQPIREDETVTFLLVLPSEAGESKVFGDPVTVFRKLDVHNKHRMVVACPTLTDVPWCADHPSDPAVKQESYLVRAVVPALKSLYPAKQSRVFLLGYSKSGWGAVNLLCRNLGTFDAAVVWDAPLMLNSNDKFEVGKILPTAESFAKHYLPDQIKNVTRTLRKSPRLAILGNDYFPDHAQRCHELLDELKIPHVYDNSITYEHRWDSGWAEKAVEKLLELTKP